MKLAILADIHGNLEALEAVLIAAEKAQAERIISLGDVVGYGADPRGCIYRLQEAKASLILGNHDQAIVDPSLIRSFNCDARQTLIGTRELLSQEMVDLLGTAAFRRVEFGGFMAHANPIRPEAWELLFAYDQIAWCMERSDWPVGFFGHTHHAGIYCQMGSRVVSLTSSRVAIGPHKYMINPGSVGQPRDGDWRAAFALWDVNENVIELHRIEYPVEKAQQKIESAGWPIYQAERLMRGE